MSERQGAAGPEPNVSSYAVRNVRAVLPDRVVEDATVVAEEGRIVSIEAGGAAPPGAVDGRGAFCLPGIIDTHSDGLEKEAKPRPGVPFPLAFALGSFEGRVRAAGVTTIFHGVAFENGKVEDRSVEVAQQTCLAIDERRATGAAIDHRILHRLDARDPDGLEALRSRLVVTEQAVGPEPSSSLTPLVSFEDHTPGQGQFADPSMFSAYIESTQGVSRAEADAEVARMIVDRDQYLDQRDRAIAWLGDQARAGRVRLLAHDPADPDEVAEALAWGVAVAEFPTSLDAAAAARDGGLHTVLGAPNILRGGSHSGNVAAEELVAEGMCTALASDYMPSTLLAAAFQLSGQGTAPLPEAVALITSGPATVCGLTDRGQLAPGLRADTILVTMDCGWPTVRTVFTADPAASQYGGERVVVPA